MQLLSQKDISCFENLKIIIVEDKRRENTKPSDGLENYFISSVDNITENKINLLMEKELVKKECCGKAKRNTSKKIFNVISWKGICSKFDGCDKELGIVTEQVQNDKHNKRDAFADIFVKRNAKEKKSVELSEYWYRVSTIVLSISCGVLFIVVLLLLYDCFSRRRDLSFNNANKFSKGPFRQFWTNFSKNSSSKEMSNKSIETIDLQPIKLAEKADNNLTIYNEICSSGMLSVSQPGSANQLETSPSTEKKKKSLVNKLTNIYKKKGKNNKENVDERQSLLHQNYRSEFFKPNFEMKCPNDDDQNTNNNYGEEILNKSENGFEGYNIDLSNYDYISMNQTNNNRNVADDDDDELEEIFMNHLYKKLRFE